MKLLGVSGVSGKTAAVHILADMLKTFGKKTGYFSSMRYSLDGNAEYSTTYNSIVKKNGVKSLLNEMSKNGCEYAIIEILPQKSFSQVKLDSITITDLDPYKKSVLDEKKIIQQILKKMKGQASIIIDPGDKNVASFLKQNEKTLKKSAPIINILNVQRNVQLTQEGTVFEINGIRFGTRLIGQANYKYTLLAVTTLLSKFLKITGEEVILNLRQIPGQMELVTNTPFTIIIDEARHPHEFFQSLFFLNKVKPKDKNLIAVFGCERNNIYHEIGNIAANYSSICILTIVDAKKDKVIDINTEIYQQTKKSNGVMLERFENEDEFKSINMDRTRQKASLIINRGETPFLAFDENHITGRKNAIQFALKFASERDIVYVAGKGNQNTLTVGPIEYEWSDRDNINKYLRQRQF